MSVHDSRIFHCGVDVGASSVKVVECVTEAGRPKLRTYAYYEAPYGEVIDINDAVSTGNLIARVLKKAGVVSTSVTTALPTASVFSSLISLTGVEKKEFQKAVEWEAKKLIPLPLEQMVLDWKVVSPVGKGQKTSGTTKEVSEILITAALRTMVDAYLAAFKTAGATVKSLETEGFALIRSLIGNDPTPTVVIDVGYRRSSIIFVRRGVPVLSKSLEIGGAAFNRGLGGFLGVADDQLEQIKRDAHRFEGLFDSIFPDTFRDACVPLVNELRYMITAYSARNETSKPERIILTGGSSLVPLLSEHLSQTFSLSVFHGDPWARVMYPEEMRLILDDIGPRFSVATGLAMRSFS